MVLQNPVTLRAHVPKVITYIGITLRPKFFYRVRYMDP